MSQPSQPAFVFESLPLSPMPQYADQPEAEYDQLPEAQPRETQDMDVDQVEGPSKEDPPTEDAPAGEVEAEAAPVEIDAEDAPVSAPVQRASPMQLRSLSADGPALEAATAILALTAARCTPKRPSSEEATVDDDDTDDDVQSDAAADEYDDTKHQHHTPTQLYMSQQAHNDLVRQLNAVLTDIKGHREPVDESMRFKTHYNLFSSITRQLCEAMDYACVPNQDKTQFNTYVAELWNDLSSSDKEEWKAQLPYYTSPFKPKGAKSDAPVPRKAKAPKPKAAKVKRVKPNPSAPHPAPLHSYSPAASSSSSSSGSSSPSRALAAMQVSSIAPAMARVVESPPATSLVQMSDSVLNALCAIRFTSELRYPQLTASAVLRLLETTDDLPGTISRLTDQQRIVAMAILETSRPNLDRDDIARRTQQFFTFPTSKNEQL